MAEPTFLWSVLLDTIFIMIMQSIIWFLWSNLWYVCNNCILLTVLLFIFALPENFNRKTFLRPWEWRKYDVWV